MRNKITSREIYGKLTQTSNLHSMPLIDGDVIIWKIYVNAYIRAYCDSYDTCIELFDNLSDKSIIHWHPDEDDMFDELCSLGKEGNILVLRKTILGKRVCYIGPEDKMPESRNPSKMICFIQN